MLHKSFKPAKCKTSLKLAIPRIKLLKNKKDVQIKQLKGELAKLLETGQDQTARIRVEHVMRELRTKDAYEFIEIYCELIVARMPIIEAQKNCPLDLKEAVASVIFASPRCADIPELMDVHKQFTAKYGKEFTSAATELRPECGVSRTLVDKLSSRAPEGRSKIKILSAIAEEYNVKWESEVFEEKLSMPPTDLLNGPSTFEKASRIRMEPIQMEPIEVQLPVYHDYKGPHNIRFPPKHDKNHVKAAVYNLQNPVSAPDSQKSSFSYVTISSGAYKPELRRPEIDDSRTEFRHSSFSGENWNMEFKNATSAAQAAAESAERASMAARAAAEIASQGNTTAQCSSTSHNSSAYKLTDENDPEFSYSNSPEKHIAKDLLSTGAKSEVVDKYPEVNNPFEKHYCKSETEYVSEQPEVAESESSLNIGVERIGKESRNDDVILEDKKSGSDAGENPFASDDLDQGSVAIETSFHVNAVVFDESNLDDDMAIKDQTRQSGFNLLSPERKSLTNPWDPSRIISEEPPLFSESSSSTGPSQIDNLLPMTFDPSDGPSSESEEEIEKSKLNQDSGKYSSKQNVDTPSAMKSVLDGNQSESHSSPESSAEKNLDYSNSAKVVMSTRNVSNDAADEETDQWTQKSPRILLQNEVTGNIYLRGSVEAEKETRNSEASSPESVSELNFMNLRGGFRNQKPYTRPSYAKNPSGNNSENSDCKIEKKRTPVPSSSFGHNGVSSRSAQDDDDSDEESANHRKVTAKVANKYVDPHSSDSEIDLSVQTSNKPRPNIGVSRRRKGTSLNADRSSRSSLTPEFANERTFPITRSPEASSTQSSCTKSENFRSEERLSQFDMKEVAKIIPESRPSEDEKLKLSTEEQPSNSLPKTPTEKAIDGSKSSRGETPSTQKSAHVHPKLPDYDTLTAHFLSLRKNG